MNYLLTGIIGFLLGVGLCVFIRYTQRKRAVLQHNLLAKKQQDLLNKLQETKDEKVPDNIDDIMRDLGR